MKPGEPNTKVKFNGKRGKNSKKRWIWGEGIVNIDMLSHKTLKKQMMILMTDLNDFKNPYMSSKEDKNFRVCILKHY